MSDPAITTLVAVVVGFGLAEGAIWLRDWRTARTAKRSFAASLLAEVVSQAHWCVERGNAWNLYSAGTEQLELGLARRDRPPEARVFNILVGQIGLLEPKDASTVIAFFGAVDLVRARIDGLGSEREGTVIRGGSVKDVAKKWRAACFNAMLAMKALEPIAKTKPLQNDAAALSKLKNDLKVVAEGRVLQAEPE